MQKRGIMGNNYGGRAITEITRILGNRPINTRTAKMQNYDKQRWPMSDNRKIPKVAKTRPIEKIST